MREKRTLEEMGTPTASVRFSVERACASCGGVARYEDRPLYSVDRGVVLQVHRQPDWDRCGVDRRPAYDHGERGSSLEADAAVLAAEIALEECGRCGHVAPRVHVPYPRVGQADEIRRALAASYENDAVARRYLYVAELYGDVDAREQGRWVLRAAWADEAGGFVERAR